MIKNKIPIKKTKTDLFSYVFNDILAYTSLKLICKLKIKKKNYLVAYFLIFHNY